MEREDAWLASSCDDSGRALQATASVPPVRHSRPGDAPPHDKRAASWDNSNTECNGARQFAPPAAGRGDGAHTGGDCAHSCSGSCQGQPPASSSTREAAQLWLPRGLSASLSARSDERHKAPPASFGRRCMTEPPSDEASLRLPEVASLPEFGTLLPPPPRPPGPPPPATASAAASSVEATVLAAPETASRDAGCLPRSGDDGDLLARRSSNRHARPSYRESWGIRSSLDIEPSAIFDDLHSMFSPAELRALRLPAMTSAEAEAAAWEAASPRRRSARGAAQSPPFPRPSHSSRRSSSHSEAAGPTLCDSPAPSRLPERASARRPARPGALSAGGAERTLPLAALSLLRETSEAALASAGGRRNRTRGFWDMEEPASFSSSSSCEGDAEPPATAAAADSPMVTGLRVRTVREWLIAAAPPEEAADAAEAADAEPPSAAAAADAGVEHSEDRSPRASQQQPQRSGTWLSSWVSRMGLAVARQGSEAAPLLPSPASPASPLWAPAASERPEDASWRSGTAWTVRRDPSRGSHWGTQGSYQGSYATQAGSFLGGGSSFVVGASNGAGSSRGTARGAAGDAGRAVRPSMRAAFDLLPEMQQQQPLPALPLRTEEEGEGDVSSASLYPLSAGGSARESSGRGPVGGPAATPEGPKYAAAGGPQPPPSPPGKQGGSPGGRAAGVAAAGPKNRVWPSSGARSGRGGGRQAAPRGLFAACFCGGGEA